MTKADPALAVNTAPVTEKTSTAAKVAHAKPADAKSTDKVPSAAKDCKRFFASAASRSPCPASSNEA